MPKDELDRKLIDRWLWAAEELEIRIVAPARMRDRRGEPFTVEVFVPDFGSPAGGLVMSRRTERHLRPTLRAMPGLFVAVDGLRASSRKRQDFICTLEDWGWFGPPGDRPDWYMERR